MKSDLCEKCGIGIEEAPGGCGCDKYYYAECVTFSMPCGGIIEIKANRPMGEGEFIEADEEVDGLYYVVFCNKKISMLSFKTKLAAMTYCMGAQWGSSIVHGM